MNKLKYITVKQEFGFSLSQENKDKWFQLTNRFYIGSKKVPIGKHCSQEHKDAHWHVNASRRVELEIKLYEDGSMEIMPVSSFQGLQQLIKNS